MEKVEFKVISGAQNGSDQAGLRAAKKAGVKTGGSIPKGFRTLDGPRPDLAAEFNLTEHASSGYPGRTEQNVVDSDGTIRFAADFNSPGERCTMKAIRWHNKPFFDVQVLNPPSPEQAAKWILQNNIKVLNVAGNSEKTSPGIGRFVEDYMTRFLEKLFESL